MLRVDLIERYVDGREHEKLLRGLIDNGLTIPLPLRARLAQGAVAALSLGLRRVVELTYGPTPLSRRLTDALLRHQRPDGAFDGGGDAGDPLATAAAVAALSRLIQDHPAAVTADLRRAHEQALAALACSQSEDGLFVCGDDRTEADRALAAAFILFLLAGDVDFRAVVRSADLLRWFDERADHLDAPTAELYRLACLNTPAADRDETPAVAAIAA